MIGLKDDRQYCRGDLYIADLGSDPRGITGSHVQSGVRPVILLQNDLGNLSAPTLIVVPMTSKIWKKPDQPSHYLVRRTQGLFADSLALAEQITTIDKRQCLKFIGKLRPEDVEGILNAVLYAVGNPIAFTSETELP